MNTIHATNNILFVKIIDVIKVATTPSSYKNTKKWQQSVILL